jgi:hypothetical protein
VLEVDFLVGTTIFLKKVLELGLVSRFLKRLLLLHTDLLLEELVFSLGLRGFIVVSSKRRLERFRHILN